MTDDEESFFSGALALEDSSLSMAEDDESFLFGALAELCFTLSASSCFRTLLDFTDVLDDFEFPPFCLFVRFRLEKFSNVLLASSNLVNKIGLLRETYCLQEKSFQDHQLVNEEVSH